MARKPLFSFIFYPVLVLIFAATLAIVWFADWSARRFYVQLMENRLTDWADLAASLSQNWYEDRSKLDSLAHDLDSRTGIRFTFIAGDGTVLSDSRQDASQMENHCNRPEVLSAMRGGKGLAVRSSPTLKQDMMYLALLPKDAAERIFVIRAALPLTAINAALKKLYWRIALSWAFIFAGAGLTSYLIARQVTRPVLQMQTAAAEFGAGNFKARVPAPAIRELDGLAKTLNRTAAQLNAKIDEVTRRRNELDTVLSSMNEGLLAVDNANRLLLVNRAAERMLGLVAATAIGRPLPEVVRQPQIVNFFNRFSPSADGVDFGTYEIEWEGKILNLSGTRLLNSAGQHSGALVVLADVTRLHNLETVRRDFIANVSHELRTPITSIKGAAETISEAVKSEPDAAERFLEIIRRNSERMAMLIEDLLSLARLEQRDINAKLTMEPVSLNVVAQNAMNICVEKSAAKNIQVTLTGEAFIQRGNPQLLEQAIANLLDNAVKNSPPGAQIKINLKQDNQEASILVEDHGCGIEAQHLPRLFERFYRVDASRSRSEGGTGLGLAIVKHITLAHKGRVSVASVSGAGSAFGMHLPV